MDEFLLLALVRRIHALNEGEAEDFEHGDAAKWWELLDSDEYRQAKQHAEILHSPSE